MDADRVQMPNRSEEEMVRRVLAVAHLLAKGTFKTIDHLKTPGNQHKKTQNSEVGVSSGKDHHHLRDNV